MTRALAILALLVAGWTVRAADSLVWYPKARTFDLNIMSMPLEKFLGMVRAETGWEVMVEPGLTRKVSGKFRDRRASSVLRLMLGQTRFSLQTRTKGGTRLKVYAGNARRATQAVAAVKVEAFAEPVKELPAEDDGRLLNLEVKVHYMRSKFPALKGDPKMTDLRPLIAGVNEIWRKAGVRFTVTGGKSIQAASLDAEKTYADLFKPGVTDAVVRQLFGKTIYKLLPDFPDRGRVIHIVVVHTMPLGYGALYMPSKGVVLMPQIKYAELVMDDGVWKNGSKVFFAQSNVLAHEFGHALSLKHVAEQGNLMIDGTLRQGTGVGPGEELTAEQIAAARKQAFTGGPYVPGINPKPTRNQRKPD